MAAKDGMFYAAKGKPDPVVKPGEFVFSAVGLDHGHIYGMTSGLLDAGATLKYVYDPDPPEGGGLPQGLPPGHRRRKRGAGAGRPGDKAGGRRLRHQ